MPDESRVFDVSRPSKTSPSATSKPVIVGHHPVMSDPMVRGAGDFGAEGPDPATKIPITDASLTVAEAMAAHTSDHPVQSGAEPEAAQGSPAVFSDPSDGVGQPGSSISPEFNHPESVANGPFTEVEPQTPPEPPVTELPQPAEPAQSHIEGLHFAKAERKGSPFKKLLLALLVLLIASYLVIDSGLVKTSFNLPFHIFKQKTQTASTPPPAANQPAASGPTLPAGFKEYKVSGTSLTFAAPTAWGNPTSITDPGFSKRGGTNQSDGTYAYLVNFDVNKDVQIAVTSSKYLPAVRTATYYDYLQWCTGTNDNLIYESALNFSTANKIDTPTTITCNQGPVAGATKLDSSAIIQAKAQDTANKIIGDIYTNNLNNDSLVVFRVKDTAMANGTAIKQLLGTIQIPATGGVTAAGQ